MRNIFIAIITILSIIALSGCSKDAYTPESYSLEEGASSDSTTLKRGMNIIKIHVKPAPVNG